MKQILFSMMLFSGIVFAGQPSLVPVLPEAPAPVQPVVPVQEPVVEKDVAPVNASAVGADHPIVNHSTVSEARVTGLEGRISQLESEVSRLSTEVTALTVQAAAPKKESVEVETSVEKEIATPTLAEEKTIEQSEQEASIVAQENVPTENAGIFEEVL